MAKPVKAVNKICGGHTLYFGSVKEACKAFGVSKEELVTGKVDGYKFKHVSESEYLEGKANNTDHFFKKYLYALDKAGNKVGKFERPEDAVEKWNANIGLIWQCVKYNKNPHKFMAEYGQARHTHLGFKWVYKWHAVKF